VALRLVLFDEEEEESTDREERYNKYTREERAEKLIFPNINFEM
jgi:hypothetical protein